MSTRLWSVLAVSTALLLGGLASAPVAMAASPAPVLSIAPEGPYVQGELTVLTVTTPDTDAPYARLEYFSAKYNTWLGLDFIDLDAGMATHEYTIAPIEGYSGYELRVDVGGQFSEPIRLDFELLQTTVSGDRRVLPGGCARIHLEATTTWDGTADLYRWTGSGPWTMVRTDVPLTGGEASTVLCPTRTAKYRFAVDAEERDYDTATSDVFTVTVGAPNAVKLYGTTDFARGDAVGIAARTDPSMSASASVQILTPAGTWATIRTVRFTEGVVRFTLTPTDTRKVRLLVGGEKSNVITLTATG